MNDVTATDGTLPLVAADPVYGPGAVLGGRYEIVDTLGRGAFGVVFRAFDRVAAETVAVKMLDRDGMAPHRSFENLARELRYARPIVHPNVCRVFDLFEHDGRPFLAMEFASGGSLKDRLAEPIARPLAARLEDARAVIAGVAAIHSAGVTHRDIKPGNVLRMADGRLAVSDFGLATRAEGATLCTTAGTPVYMAPEISVGDKPTQASDVWSLGMVLHEILFGALPEWVAAQRGAVLSCSRSHSADATSRTLHRVCGSCLANDPSRRPPDAGVLGARFDKATRNSGRRRHWTVAISLLIALVVAGVAATLRSADRADKDLALVERSRLLFETDRQFPCVDVLPGGRSLRVTELKPSTRGLEGQRVLDLDLLTQEARPSLLRAEGHLGSCPLLSPDGRMLLFTKSESGGPTRIMLSRHPDSREAEEVARGYVHVWLPSGSGFVRQVDKKRAAVAALSGQTLMLLPPPPSDTNILSGTAISQAGDVIALLFLDSLGGRRSSVVALYQYPSLKPLRMVSLPEHVASDSFVYDSARNKFQVVMRDLSESMVGEIALDGALSWLGKVRGQIAWMRRSALGVVFTTHSKTRSELWARNAAGEEQLAVSKHHVYFTAVSDVGDLAFQISPRDGGGIGIRRWGSPDLVTLTQDKATGYPSFLPGGRGLVFSRAGDSVVVRCDLDISKRSPRCRELFRDKDGGLTYYASLSPDERSLAYFRREGPGARLRIARLDGGPTLDLGPHPERCAPYWASPSRLWVQHYPELVWHELDGNTGAPTGRTARDTAGPSRLCGTPDIPSAPKTSYRAIQHSRAEVRLAEGL